MLVSQQWESYDLILLSRVRSITELGSQAIETDYSLPDIVPVIMAGIIGIYGLVVSVLISDNLKQEMPLYTGFIQLGAGLSVGLAGLAAGYGNLFSLLLLSLLPSINRRTHVCLL